MTDPLGSDREDGVLDVAQLTGLRELADASGDPCFLRTLVEEYLDEAQAQVAQLQEASARGDLPAARRLAHGLNGTSATMGASGVSSAACCIERAAAAGEPAETPSLDKLATELQRATTALRMAVH